MNAAWFAGDSNPTHSGTPGNVAPVVEGEVLLCKLDGLPDMSIWIVQL